MLCAVHVSQDPTGTMGAALHSSALQQQPQLGPGCVLLLQNVSVLTPNPGSCYLAVTADNIVQVSAYTAADANSTNLTRFCMRLVRAATAGALAGISTS